jgi:thiol-disulfide isomerase/thioredoxin
MRSCMSRHIPFTGFIKQLSKTASLLLIVMTVAPTANTYAQPNTARVGTIVPEIALPDTAGSVHRLSNLLGKIVLIDFWASWCGPCRESNPALLKVYSKYRSRDFEIYGVSLDKSPVAWKNAINADKINWVQVNDNGNTNEEGIAGWQIRFIPTSFLLDKEGKIVALNPSVRQLRSYLKKHLK